MSGGQRSLGITFIYVTHDQEDALVMSDRIIVMHAGILEQAGTPGDIYFRPKSSFVSEFIGETNLFEALVKKAEGSRLFLSSGSGESIAEGMPFNQGELVHVSVRPDKMQWSDVPVPGFMLYGTAKEILFCGSVTKTIMELSNGANVWISRLSGSPLPEQGNRLYLHWKPEDVVMHSVGNEVRSTMENVDLGGWVKNVRGG
jgi:spermidine/putrescine transport system ATP-binding protein